MDKLETPIAFKQGDEFARFFAADASVYARVCEKSKGSRREP